MMESLSTTKKFARRTAILACLLGVVLVGCEKAVPSGTVRGKVLLNDAPYADASVVFLSPDTGQAGSADIRADGTFSIETGLPVGSYVVFLAPKSAASGGGMDEPVPVSIDVSVPDKYWNEATSDISIEILEGPNDVTVRLSK